MSDVLTHFFPLRVKAPMYVTYSVERNDSSKAADREFEALLVIIGSVCAVSLVVALAGVTMAILFKDATPLIFSALGFGVTAVTVRVGEDAQKRRGIQLAGAVFSDDDGSRS